METAHKILLIGANGSAGKFMYETVALLRSQPKFDASLYPNLKIVHGDATSQETLDKVTEGVSVIISTYQDAKSNPNDALHYIQRLIISMKKNSVKRLICVTGLGLVLTEGGIRFNETQNFPPQYKRYNVDMFNGSQAIAATDLSYTYIGCPHIEEKDKEGNYNVFEVLPKDFQWQIKAGNLAHFIQEEMLNPKWERRIIGITNA